MVHVPADPNLRGIHIETYGLHGLIFRPHFLFRHVCSSARSYTDFLCLVHVAAERESSANLRVQRKCSQADRPLVIVTLERLSKVITPKRSLCREAERDSREVYSRVSPP